MESRKVGLRWATMPYSSPVLMGATEISAVEQAVLLALVRFSAAKPEAMESHRFQQQVVKVLGCSSVAASFPVIDHVAVSVVEFDRNS